MCASAVAVVCLADASAQVVIRERVEVTAGPVRVEGPRSRSVSDCFGPVVGHAVYTPVRAWSEVDPLTGTLDVETSCGNTTASFNAFFVLDHVSKSGGYDRYAYVSAGPTGALWVPLHAVETLDRQVFRSLGEEWVRAGAGGSGQFTAEFGCARVSGCTDDPPHGAEVEVHRTWEGHATQVDVLRPAWPDTLVCGTQAPSPVVAIRPGPTEGWLSADAQASLVLPDEGDEPVAARATLQWMGGTGLSVDTDYGTVRQGMVSLVAPPCAEVPVPRSIKVRVRAAGWTRYEWVRLTPPPPVALALIAEKDTVRVTGPYGSRIRATAITADSTETMMDPPETPVTFSVESAWLEVRQEDMQVGGPSRTVPYLASYTDDASVDGVVVRIPFDTWGGPPPYYDAPVRVTASSGGVSGRTLVVVAGSNGTGPDSVDVALEDPEVDCGDSTRVFVSGLLGGEPRALPDDASVRLTVKDSTVSRLVWGDSTGVRLTVPIEAVSDGSVWLRTENCAGVEGDLSLAVYAEVDAYWDPDGVVSGEEHTTLRGGAPPAGLVVTISEPVLAPGETAVVSVDASGGDPLSDTDLVDLGLGPAAAEAGLLRLVSGGAVVDKGTSMSGVPVKAFRDGTVLYQVHAYLPDEPPPAVVEGEERWEASADDGTDAPPPGPSAPSHPLDGVEVALSATLSADSGVSGTANVIVLPYGVRLRVSPVTSRVGEELTATVEVVSAVQTPSAYQVPEWWTLVVAVTGNVFVCAEDLLRDPDTGESAHPASFPFLQYGRAEAADAECAAFRRPGWSALDPHEASFRYPGPLGPTTPDGPFSPSVYGGLAVEQPDGTWSWAAGPPEGLSFRPLVESQTLEVFSATDRIVRFEVSVSEDEVWPHIVAGHASSQYPFGIVDPTVDEVVVRLIEDGVPVEGATIQIEAVWVEGSGGHAHDKTRELAPPSSLMGMFTRADGQSATAIVSAVTGSDGEARVSYQAPQFGGEVVLRATTDYADAVRTDTALVRVQVPGLERLPDRPDLYYRVGGTCDHHGPREIGSQIECPPGVDHDDFDHNHHAHPDVSAALARIAERWRDISPQGFKIAINDLSLPNGGRFDVVARWSGLSNHKFHRVGYDADVRTRRGPPDDGVVHLEWGTNVEFEDIVLEEGGRAEIHSPGTSNEHYHVFFYDLIDAP